MAISVFFCGIPHITDIGNGSLFRGTLARTRTSNSVM